MKWVSAVVGCPTLPRCKHHFNCWAAFSKSLLMSGSTSDSPRLTMNRRRRIALDDLFQSGLLHIQITKLAMAAVSSMLYTRNKYDVWLTSIQCLKEVVRSHSSVVTSHNEVSVFIHSFIHVPKYNNMKIYISN